MRIIPLVVLLAACGSKSPSGPLEPGSPWPKFRRDARQDGRSPARGRPGGKYFSFPTGKGIFSSPIVAADGTIYVGSADKTFYAVNPDGSLRWKAETGEIIDSAGLLDDHGLVYFGSGDGMERALDAKTGAPVWTMTADAPTGRAFIRWFEGNVAIAPGGDLIVPNDNHYVYDVDRTTGKVSWRDSFPDQTWSLPAIDDAGDMFLGNNNIDDAFGPNVNALGPTGATLWSYMTLGTMAASPLVTGGQVLAGGFDGILYAFDAKTGAKNWTFLARDHLYASPAEAADGTIVQAGADGSVYGLDPATGSVRWSYDTRDPIRSSPAIDGDGNIYVGTGDGRLLVLGPDGKFAWAVKLIDADRDDLNSSPALGADAIYIGGESGELFSVPYDLCTGAAPDARCQLTDDQPTADGAVLEWTSLFGQTGASPATIDPDAALVFSLRVREGGQTLIPYLDAASTTVTVTPTAAVTTEISGDGKFAIVTPVTGWTAGTDGTVTVTISGNYLVGLDRHGLKLSGGTPGGVATGTVHALVSTPPATPFVPSLSPPTTWAISRVALPLPTLLPSYNQIGFDSLGYLVGLVEFDGAHGVGWMIGAGDPTSQAILPLVVSWDGGFLTMASAGTVSLVIMNATISFRTFRLAAAVDGTGASPAVQINGSTICANIPVYGSFLEALGLCNSQTDVLAVAGGANFGLAPAATVPSVGTVTWAAAGGRITATLAGGAVRADQHLASILLVDDATGVPVTLDYGPTTTRQVDGAGNVTSVTIPVGASPPAMVRAYLMIDATAAASATLAT
jgi:outer membrane protein assembly factor BamB